MFLASGANHFIILCLLFISVQCQVQLDKNKDEYLVTHSNLKQAIAVTSAEWKSTRVNTTRGSKLNNRKALHILSVEFNQNVESKLEYVEFMW